jgi:tRNA C32,U32 (ribose-2'-O)-methylase TrmJ
MNNFSLLAANRLTHLKVVAVALVFSTLVVGIGFAARVTHGFGTANVTVVKPGILVTATAGEPRTIR